MALTLRLFRHRAPTQASPRVEVTHLDVEHCGRVHRVALKRVANARRFTLRVRAATRDALLTMPMRGSLAGAREFAERNAAWIAARLDRLPRAAPFEPGASVPLRGAEHGTMHVPDARGVAWVARVGGAPFVCVAGRREHFARRLADFLKREARRDVEAAVARHAGALGMRPAGVSIRDTRSRWGSCSHGGALNFSWRLILAPPFVLDYLCAHEVAHLAHMDHSARFWALTRRLCPRTDEAEAWLRVNGSALHRFGAQDGEEPADGGAVD